jgi:ABC-2 type transport system ATP-binding protein
MQNAFELSGIIKYYNDFVLGPLDFSLQQGTVMGYIGNNGAGKTTTIHILSGLIVPDYGESMIFGMPIKPNTIDWKYKLGYVGEAGGFYEAWKVSKNLKFISDFYPNWDNKYMLELVSRLSLDVNKKVRDLSSGNRMKLKLVVALSHRPNLLLLDEPSSGLDPVVRAEFTDILREYMESESNSILYSTHILSDISRLADEFTFLIDGKITQRQNREDLLSAWRTVIIKSDEKLDLSNNIISIEKSDGTYIVISNNWSETQQEIQSKGYVIDSVNPMSLEDITIQILKRAKHV